MPQSINTNAARPTYHQPVLSRRTYSSASQDSYYVNVQSECGVEDDGHVLDKDKNKICVKDKDGNCAKDDKGNVIFIVYLKVL